MTMPLQFLTIWDRISISNAVESNPIKLLHPEFQGLCCAIIIIASKTDSVAGSVIRKFLLGNSRSLCDERIKMRHQDSMTSKSR